MKRVSFCISMFMLLLLASCNKKEQEYIIPSEPMETSRIIPPSLKPGDVIGLIAPAGIVTEEAIANGEKMIRDFGFTPKRGNFLLDNWGRFSASDEKRAADLQMMINDPEVKAIQCVRGGYGSARIVDMVNFTSLKKHPKWLIGFSDITVFHSYFNRNLAVASIHGPMPISYSGNASTPGVLESLKDCLIGQYPSYELTRHAQNREGEATAEIIGGNLTILISVLESNADIDTDGKILFLEDVGENYYKIDRSMLTLKRAGKLDKLKGIVLGHFTDVNDQEPFFGQTLEEIIKHHVAEYDYPVMYNFPAGHEFDNFALVFGMPYHMKVDEKGGSLRPVR